MFFLKKIFKPKRYCDICGKRKYPEISDIKNSGSSNFYCEKCKADIEKIRNSLRITSILNTFNKNQINSITDDKLKNNISLIMEEIKKEKTNATLNKKKIFPSRAIYSGAALAAVIAVFFLLNQVFEFETFFTQSTKTDEMINEAPYSQLAGDSGERSIDESVKSGHPEIYLPPDQDYINSKNGILLYEFISKEYNISYIELTKIDLHSFVILELIDTEGIYTGLYSEVSSEKMDDAKKFFENTNIPAELIIITGDNYEKLIEYAGEDFYQRLSQDTLSENMRNLLIKIGR